MGSSNLCWAGQSTGNNLHLQLASEGVGPSCGTELLTLGSDTVSRQTVKTMLNWDTQLVSELHGVESHLHV